MLRQLFIIALILGFQPLKAQVFAPDPLCVAGDTIFWDLPVNTCGPFISYDIYFATDPAGPFNLLDMVPNVVQDFYFHSNPGNETYYYYMQSNYDCPSDIPLQSDTISNIPPQDAPILGVNVTGNLVELEWDPSPSPEVYGYVIYRLIGANVDPIDTVFGGTTYIDFSADPNLKSEQYFVLALDPCGNTSIFLDPHSTIYLTLTQDPCERTFLLEWNPYDYFNNGLDSQEIWMTVNGGFEQQIAAVDPGVSSFVFEDVEDENQYCFFIRAIENTTARPSNSNVACIDADIIRPVEDLALTNVSIIDGSAEVSWVWGVDAELTGADINVQPVGSPASQTFPWLDFIEPLSPSNFTSLPINQITGPIEYSVSVTDQCGDVNTVGPGVTIFIEGDAPFPGEFDIEWTAFDLPDADIVAYDIYRFRGMGIEFVGEVPATQLLYEDFIEPKELDEEAVCYYVEARFDLLLPDSTIQTNTSRSNVICLRPEPQIFVPNVFSPTGQSNRQFRPFAEFAEPGTSYSLQIFSRWGALVFQTNDPLEGWDGTFNGKLQPSGVYIYQYTLTSPTYGVFERSGDVTLIR